MRSSQVYSRLAPPVLLTRAVLQLEPEIHASETLGDERKAKETALRDKKLDRVSNILGAADLYAAMPLRDALVALFDIHLSAFLAASPGVSSHLTRQLPAKKPRWAEEKASWAGGDGAAVSASEKSALSAAADTMEGWFQGLEVPGSSRSVEPLRSCACSCGCCALMPAACIPFRHL